MDDTAAAILALVRRGGRAAVRSPVVARAAAWVCGMQNRDGGWGAFDLDNDSLWLNKIPFSDMDALCDPSSADVTGRVLEAFGLLLQPPETAAAGVEAGLAAAIEAACRTGLFYLASTQEAAGAWYGRWGSNYVYGTSNVLCGLRYFARSDDIVADMAARAADWLKQVQNADGGWGEDLASYRDASLAGRGPSTPSQTAWGLMGLLSVCEPDDPAVAAAVSHLAATQTAEEAEEDNEHQQPRGMSWPETAYTGTGFPNFFYIGYTLYRHYFPMMALGRYVSSARAKLQAANLKSRGREDDDEAART
ncbi:hypothetical protein CDD83_9479 [Cordyceps sp. RAO-2017]|nr:hypothetical protein CDD83_9479 [Cordyceps sp. RAO-2017]